MKNRIVLLFICLVASQSSIFAQDRYFPATELTQLFELDKATEDEEEIIVPSTMT